MTPEREEYERQKASTERDLAVSRREMYNLTLHAEMWGLILTIKTQALQPPAMGKVVMVPSVRISRERLRELETLRLAAEKSEEEGVRDA